VYVCVCVCVCVCACTNAGTARRAPSLAMGWLRLVGSLKL